MHTGEYKLQNFCQKYNATVQDSYKRYRRAKLVKFNFDDLDKCSQSFDYDDVPMVEIHMPVDSFNGLVALDNFLQNIRDTPPNRYSELLKEYEQECHIRYTNPAVQAAYQEYLMLLTLVR
jgi:thioredoxin-like negative regulator of GroEL